MSYPINVQLINGLPKSNYRHGYGKPEGIVLHDTDNAGATAAGNHSFEARTWKNAFVHFFVDWKEIIQNASTDFIAYGAGYEANQRFIHIELCCTKDKKQFADSYSRYVWLAAAMLIKYNLQPKRRVTLWTHHDVTNVLGGTTHTDPDKYLAAFGVSVDKLIADITSAYDKLKHPAAAKKVIKKVTPKPGSKPSTYIVQPNDSLWEIGNKYKINVSSLKKLNGLKSDTIHPGQVLKLKLLAKKPNVYYVQPGDALWTIAQKNHVSVDQLMKLNNLHSTTIQPKQALKLK